MGGRGDGVAAAGVVNGLVLSLFPGLGFLDAAFEAEGFCVVRGPDLLWGGDVEKFHPTPGAFDGVIGGPPCQAFSRLRHIVEANGYEIAPNLIPEYERVVAAARPAWFLMENVPDAPEPMVEGYDVSSALVDDASVGGQDDAAPAVLVRGTRRPRWLHVLGRRLAALPRGRGSGRDSRRPRDAGRARGKREEEAGDA